MSGGHVILLIRADLNEANLSEVTYHQADPMGLFCSMTPAAGAEPRGYTSAAVAPLHVEFTAEVDGSAVASRRIERRLMARGCVAHRSA